jgi:hypothetical protein
MPVGRKYITEEQAQKRQAIYWNEALIFKEPLP